MFTIDRRIEKIENQLIYLNSIKDDMQIEVADGGTMIADEMRMAVDNLIESIMESVDFHESGLDESEIEDELREEIVEVVRMDF